MKKSLRLDRQTLVVLDAGSAAVTLPSSAMGDTGPTVTTRHGRTVVRPTYLKGFEHRK